MPLDDLLAICPPPAKPQDCPTPADWTALETQVGHRLPSDYKAFLARYGTGVFGCYEDRESFFNLVKVLVPHFPPDRRGLNAIPEMMRWTELIGELHRDLPDIVPLPAWPAPGGLLYFGSTPKLRSFYWRTVGDDADAWTCDATDSGSENWFHWDGDMTSFLAAIAAKRVPDWIVEGATKFPLVFEALDDRPGFMMV
jgi:hypothetical protein